MFTCMFCGARKETLMACSYCYQRHCAGCYIVHQRDKVLIQARDLGDIEGVLRRAKELRDSSPTTSASAPKIYRGGSGSPDEPPEGAGAPNRPRNEAKEDD